jgi:hypothetical protein
MRRALLLLAVLIASGCVAPGDRPRAPGLEPPPARSGAPLERERALAIAQGSDPEQAIEELDGSRFDFVLDAGTIAWFEKEGAPGEVLDYLKKRGSVDWDSLRGDVDPRSPETEAVDPRRGFDDWAGFGRRESYASSGGLDPFTR